MKIYKYPLTVHGEQEIRLKLFETLCVMNQNNTPVLYAMVDDDLPEQTLSVSVVFTGEEANLLGKYYVGTLQLIGASLATYVLHVFAKIKSWTTR